MDIEDMWDDKACLELEGRPFSFMGYQGLYTTSTSTVSGTTTLEGTFTANSGTVTFNSLTRYFRRF